MSKEKLLDFLKSNAKKIPMHMPGHKRRTDILPEDLPWGIDVTEVEPFDNLHEASGVLRQSQDFAAELWGSDNAYFLVNGSTGGILSAIRAATKAGDKIIVARNCHMSVFHAIELCDLVPVAVNPELEANYGFWGKLNPRTIEKALEENPEASLVVITSPTYEGIISDVSNIVKMAHEKNVPLLVDEAHGAHLRFTDMADKSAVACGADVVVHSLHKTLPSLTQTGVLHVNGRLVDRQRVKHELAVFQSSSPSYPLMASIDSCVHLMQDSGERRYEESHVAVKKLRENLKCMKNLELINLENADPYKLVISALKADITGNELAQKLLKDYGISTELACEEYILAMTSFMDRKEDIKAFVQALLEIDKSVGKAKIDKFAKRAKLPPVGKQVMSLARAIQGEKTSVSLTESIGEISTEYVWQYPPGIPILLPGQEIGKEFVAWAESHSGELHVSCGDLKGRLNVAVSENNSYD